MKQRPTIYLLLLLLAVETTGKAEGLNARLHQHVVELTTGIPHGRREWSDRKSAARYISTQLAEMQIEPWRNAPSYLQFFDGDYRFNVVGQIIGTDQQLTNEWIIIGAHFDHLPGQVNRDDDRIYFFPGANDNASGVAVLLEMARILASTPTRRSLLIVFFDNEESGQRGAKHLIRQLDTTQTNARLMLNLDMVGTLSINQQVDVMGTGMLTDGDRIFAQAFASKRPVVSLKPFDSYSGGTSDHAPFARAGIPAIYISTGLHAPYHTPDDTPERLDYAGMDSITTTLTTAVQSLANQPQLNSSGLKAPKHEAPSDLQRWWQWFKECLKRWWRKWVS